MKLSPPVIHVIAIATLNHLRLAFTSDRAAAMPVFNEVAGMHHLMLLVDLLFKKRQDSIPKLPVNSWLASAHQPLNSKLDFTDAGLASENCIEFATTNLRC